MDDKLYHYRGEVTNVVDGDTVDIMFDLGLNIFVKQRIRLYGIDTPEIFGLRKESEEYQRGIEAKEFVSERVLNKRVWIKTHKDKTGKYGRYLADIFIQDENGKHASVGKLLLEEGLAKEYE